MAFFCKSSQTWHAHLHSSIIVFLFITLCFTSTTNSISFNISHFQHNDLQILFEGDSFLGSRHNSIELAKNSAEDTRRDSVGCITYSEPIQLWDANTGRLEDFSTHFSFSIKGINDSTSYGDGVTFFLAPFESVLPPNSHGGSLSLMNANVADKTLTTSEFDSYKNGWDPSSDHAGINVNSIVSVPTMSIEIGSTRDGRNATAWVTYNSTTKNLSVFLTSADNPAINGNSTLFYIIDLKKILPEKIRVGFSTATGWGIETHKILSRPFNSTLQVAQRSKAQSILTALAIGVAVGVGGTCILLGVSLLIWLKKRRGNARNNDEERAMDDEFKNGTGPRRFSYNELVHATSNFDEAGKLGQGGFGAVYKGFLSELRLNVAVKSVSGRSEQGKKEYKSEVRIISQLRHRNLVQLVGWCHERNKLLLVYDFMPNRSLNKHLFRGENVLHWEVRYKIALGLASALLYLHELCVQCVVHRDIKSSNVMLDSDFNAKLGDFGLARIVDHGEGSQTTVIAGTRGYIAPECFLTGQFNKESDIYSFGIVALEIACGRKPVEIGKLDLVEWVWGLYGNGKIVEAADERLQMEFNESEMEQLMVVGLWCAHPDSKQRPSISQVINVLKFESQLPKLPLVLATPVHLTSAVASATDFASLTSFTDTLTGR